VVPGAPASVAIALLDPSAPASSERLLVLDLQPARLLVYALDGTYDASATQKWNAVNAALSTPVSLAFGGGALYVADAGTGQVLAFGADGSLIGVVPRADAPVAGLALDCHGRLVVHPGSGGAVLRAGDVSSYAQCGSFLAGPFVGDATPARWQRVRVCVDALPVGAHLQLYCLASDALDGSVGHAPSAPASCGSAPFTSIVASTSVDLAPLDTWRAAPRDAGDLLALTPPSRYLWLAAVLQGDGTVTPTVRQVRLEYDAPGWLRFLPAIYRNDPIAALFLERALALFRSFLEDEYGAIAELPALFDANAAPDGDAHPTWLDWLASWFATDLDERWSEATRRTTVGSAFRRDAWRGTRGSLRRLVGLYAGVTPWIDELGVGASAWSLGVVSRLGFDTTLCAESPEGAVLGDTAVVDRSALIDAASYGTPLFADIANRFTARVYAAELPLDAVAATLARVRTVLDREKPAHTTYDLCVIEPAMRVGSQALVGIDTIVGGAPVATPFDGTLELGSDTVLAGDSRRRSRMSLTGQDARVGVRSTLV
jgi:phage tail-like protein